METHDSTPGKNQEQPESAMKNALSNSFLICGASSALVVFGVIFGQQYVIQNNISIARPTDLIGSFAVWDGEHYVSIARYGYNYDPNAGSRVAFCPAYPLAGRLLAAVTGWRMDFSLLFVSYVFLIAAFVVAALYVDERSLSHQSKPAAEGNEAGCAQTSNLTLFVLLAFGFFPTTFFFRMAYSESFFVFEVILTLYGIKKQWPFWALAPVIGLATATRLPGVALLLPLVWNLWERSPTWRTFFSRSVFSISVACWGLIAYMVFQWCEYGEPFAFVKAHRFWDQRPALPMMEKLWLELTMEPVFHIFDLESTWELKAVYRPDLLNALVFLLFAALLWYGWMKGWVNKHEGLAGWGLLLFSYFAKSYSGNMTSQARFASTVFPVYLVLGRMLQRLPAPVVAMILAVCGFFLGVYSALFSRWYPFI